VDIGIFMAVGLFAGVLSGMLGIGGGQVLVPCLLAVLAGTIPEPFLMKTVLATSLATIPFTGGWAAYQQSRDGNVDFAIVRKLALGVVAGALAGGLAAPYVPAPFLKGLFAVFALYVGVQMIVGRQPKFNADFNGRNGAIAGAATGALSSWVGIGGGAVIVPFLLAVGQPVKKATGVSSAVGVVVAAAATAGYAWSAHAQGVHLPGQWGFVHVSALLTIVSASFFGVLAGVKMAKRVNALLLKRLFALTLLAAGLKMIWSLLG
jgi:uncharacterized membrane protein YfcA